MDEQTFEATVSRVRGSITNFFVSIIFLEIKCYNRDEIREKIVGKSCKNFVHRQIY